MLSKGGLRVGDALVLTKPLGFGVTTTALKRGQAAEEDVLEAVQWMKQLNQTASQLATEFHVRGGTDITGYSLLGHGLEMANASGVSLKFNFADVPFIAGARKYAEKGMFPGGAFDNKKHFEAAVKFGTALDEPDQMLLIDPQTSGGLLLGVLPQDLNSFLTRGREAGQAFWVIGNVEEGRGIEIR
jgi:selenide,water dikinase